MFLLAGFPLGDLDLASHIWYTYIRVSVLLSERLVWRTVRFFGHHMMSGSFACPSVPHDFWKICLLEA